MKVFKHHITFGLAGILAGFAFAAHAEAAAPAPRTTMELSDISNVPLALFIVAAVFVYLCNRPRDVVHAKRRRSYYRGR